MKTISIKDNIVCISNNEAINPLTVAYTCKECKSYTDHDISKLVKLAKELLSERIDHCEGSLAKALATKQCEVKHNSIVTWEGGHFTLPIYNAMVRDFHKDWQDYSFTTWAQIMKQYAFSLAADKIRPNNDFVNFAMECLAVVRNNF